MRKILGLAVALAALLALAAPANAAPTTRPAVVPSGCTAHKVQYGLRINRDGTALSTTAVRITLDTGYSSSGGSVNLTEARIDPNDSHRYAITTNRWERYDGAVVYNGPSGQEVYAGVPSSWADWVNNAALWLPVNGRPLYSIFGYDEQYPSIGVIAQVFPC